MRRLGPGLALALLLLANAVVFLGVIQNRRGEPEAMLTLTERELPAAAGGQENSGLSLRLVWYPPFAPGEGEDWWSGSLPWLDRERLQALGFDCSVPPTDPRAEIHYRRALPRVRYAALEFEGPPWQAWLDGERTEIERLRRDVTAGQEAARTLEFRERRFAAAQVSRSRLTLVDLGSDPAALRRQHPDRRRTAIVPAVVRLRLERPWNARTRTPGEPRLRGDIQEILVSEINVPRSLRPPLDTLLRRDERARTMRGPGFGAPGEPRPPRYEATLFYGHRLEPWLIGVRPLAERP
jgi:uncharacterized protein DUF4824